MMASEVEAKREMSDDQVENVENMEAAADLKKLSTNARMHLVPRPSNNAEDPLNWPLKLKVIEYEIASFIPD